MVTDVERDYMYDEYARDPVARINLGIRRRLAPLLEGDRRRIELMNGLLMSLPGSPILYYGDEIGMGDNIYLGDRNGVRTPMQWSGGWNGGFSTADPERLAQPADLQSALRLSGRQRRVAEARRPLAAELDAAPDPACGSSTPRLQPGLDHVSEARPTTACWRSCGRSISEQVLVVCNLVGTAQAVELDLRRSPGRCPIEMFGKSLFPRIGELPYLLTLGPYDFYWFRLRRL